MLSTLKYIVTSNWERRSQIWHLALLDVTKSTRGTALGWIWRLIKPAMYIFAFWFALQIGLRSGRMVGDYPYILWLMSGMIPWFYMQDMINSGANVYGRYPYLVNRIPFDLPCISTIHAIGQMIVELVLMIAVFVGCMVTGYGFSIYVIQVPLLLFLMLIFWTFFSMLMSPLTAISKDIRFAIGTFSTLIFWCSGVIFNLDTIGSSTVKAVLAWDPVTVFVTGFRAAFMDRYWIWERTDLMIPFAIVFVLTIVVAVFVQKRLGKVVSDAI